MANRRPLVTINGTLSELPQGDGLTASNLSGTNTGDLTAATRAEMEAGAETALRAMSPLLVKQAILANMQVDSFSPFLLMGA